MARPPRLSFDRWRRAFRIAPGIIVAWAVTALVLARVLALQSPGSETLRTAVSRSSIIGVVAGSLGAWLETGPLAYAGRRLPL